MKRFLSKLPSIVTIAIFIGICASVILGFHHPKNQSIAPVNPTPIVLQDPILVADAASLGINVKGINLTLVSNLTSRLGSDSSSIGQPINGLFTQPNTIEINSGRSTMAETQSLAYEYMHYVWTNLPSDSQKTLGMTLQSYQDNLPDVQLDMASIVGDQYTIHSEQLSVVCTMILPSDIQDDMNSFCNKYIPNRQTVLFP